MRNPSWAFYEGICPYLSPFIAYLRGAFSFQDVDDHIHWRDVLLQCLARLQSYVDYLGVSGIAGISGADAMGVGLALGIFYFDDTPLNPSLF